MGAREARGLEGKTHAEVSNTRDACSKVVAFQDGGALISVSPKIS
ncbi:MAG: hypothetical protein QXH03_10300 [Candidatus Bathyarchaeia archaeon]